MAPRSLLSALALFALAGAATTASAGVIRHDVADSLYLSLGANAKYKSVGQVTGTTVSTEFFASGTLVASNWVLTAAHVVDQATSLAFKLGGQTFTASEWVAFPDWNGDLMAGYDIGLMRFDVNLTAATGVTAARRYTGTGEFGKTGVSVGYGMTGTGLTGATTFDQKKRAGHNKIDTVLMTEGEMNRILLSDFDGSGKPADNSMGSATPLSREFLIAKGDSGGGLFISVGTKTFLAGVHSFGWGYLDGVLDSDYGDLSGHTRVTAFNAWIDGVIAGLIATGPSDGSGITNGGPIGAFNGVVRAVPEPAGLGMLAFGALASLIALRRRRLRTT